MDQTATRGGTDPRRPADADRRWLGRCPGSGRRRPGRRVANQVFDLPEAGRRGAVYQELGIGWFEEPLPKDDIAGYEQLCRDLTIPIATGENLYTLRSFEDFFRRSACDIVQPDLRRGGGPTQLRTVAGLAHAHGVPYASHGGGPAALSLLMAAPTATWLETGLRQGNESFPRIEDGHALAPEGPGFQWEPVRIP